MGSGISVAISATALMDFSAKIKTARMLLQSAARQAGTEGFQRPTGALPGIKSTKPPAWTGGFVGWLKRKERGELRGGEADRPSYARLHGRHGDEAGTQGLGLECGVVVDQGAGDAVAGSASLADSPPPWTLIWMSNASMLPVSTRGCLAIMIEVSRPKYC